MTTATAGDPAGPDRLLRYGPHDDQRIELSHPRGQPRGTVVLIHGGYWREPFTAALMHPLVPEFTARGWAVANLEYRRGGAGWAAMHDDLVAGLAAVRSTTPTPAPDARLALVGHSVGGQLALLGGEEGDAVVALAPVTDIARGYHESIGDGAVAEFFHDAPAVIPETYAQASPIAQLPPRAAVLLVHGADDTRVPLAHTHAYLQAARAAAAHPNAVQGENPPAGATPTLLELPHLSHLDAIAPDAPHWPRVHTWLDHWQHPPRM
ncbi:alpha/beta hydrolase family protein [Herbiconiux sp. P15]|uniref:alpha/beta hydrolase family protein n=1 Tax=Herbiconiux liukaitaii TaxID=3342799 RepID=UPI0035BB7786